ncbi:MAG TPA: FN3 associated domain-containing protein [Candidatus Saccharimonadales bacterium]|nr:FN3 associated domain-containing protein [Candidatus Saccharimonadales bacterium]
MTKGVLNLDTLKFNVEWNTGFFECSTNDSDAQMFTCSGNHDGAGMSAGDLQINFGAANHLMELWQYMINNYEQLCIDAFTTHTTEYNTWKTAMLSATQQDRINFGANITDINNDHAIVEPYKTALGNLLLTPESKAKYHAIRDAYYWDEPYNLFQSLSCTSRMALASLFDIYINKGRCYPINLYTVDFEAIDANDTLTADDKENQKILLINNRANSEENSINDANTAVFAPRRDGMANQGGNYYGLTYDPSVFDMNLEPGTAQKVVGTGVKLGSLDVSNVYLGTAPIQSIYLGATLLNSAGTPFTTSLVPKTQIRTNPGGWAGIGGATSISISQGAPIWIDVQPGGMVACKTYYTTDGTEPTEASTLYNAAIVLNASCTFKCKTISVFGYAEATKTITVTVTAAPTTTISPSTTVQNTIPFTVTLTSDEQGAAIKYKLGTSQTIYDYTVPFSVNQNSPGVASTQITVKYWSVGASATEAEKSITYNTSGAIPGTPVVTATPGQGQVSLSWAATANTTSYTIYRSTTSGVAGSIISQFQPGTSLLDTTGLTAGTTYYYTVQAGNYQMGTNSAQVSAVPTAPPTKPSYRYLKVMGYGEYYGATSYTNTRLIELEIFSAAVNKAAGKTVASEAVSTGAEVGSTAPTKVTDGVKGITSNTYNIWWAATPNCFLVIDLGAQTTIDSIRYWGYTSRAPMFQIYGSNTAADLPAGNATIGGGAALIWDMQTNTTAIAGATAGTNNYIEKVYS